MWKDLTLKEKAEIMKMSVANGVTDINDIQELYDDSIGHKFDDGSRIITVGQFPQGFVDEYGDTTISTKSNKNRTTLREAFNDPAWRELHVDANSVPHLTDYLLRQDQANSIKPSEGPTYKKDFATSFNEWKEEHPTLNTIANYTPFVSTVMDGLELYTNPSLGNLSWFATDLASDIFSLGLGKGVTIGGKLINKALKGSKTITGRSRYIDWDKTSKTSLDDIIEGGEKIEKYGKKGFYQGVDLLQNHLQNVVQDEENKLALGGHLYKNAGPLDKGKQQPKYRYGTIERALVEGGAGGLFRVTSASRKPNEAGNAGRGSAHTYTLKDGSPAALDIVPNGIGWDEFFAVMNTPRMRASLAKYGFDILNETSKAMMAKTDATGAHLHVGKGIKGAKGTGDFYGGNVYGGGYGENYRANRGSYNDYQYTPQTRMQQAMKPITLSSANISSPWMDYLSKISQQPAVSFNTPIGTSKAKPSAVLNRPMAFSIPSFESTTRPEVMENVAQLPQYQSILNSTLFNDPYLLFKNA